ncbi:MAG: glycosyltransferase family 39 protein [candidate division WOR-3 bacterium]
MIIFWFLINSILGYYLNLAPDEAYYWVWSKKLSFGYFDHPPLIAFLIKLGYLIFKNEFGVRFMTILLSTITIYIVYQMLEKKNLVLFSLLIFSNLLLNAGGFIAVPDTALVFSSALFFYFLRDYLKNESYKSIIFLSIAISLMLYSKYHGILIILFTIFSIPNLIFRKSFYLIFFFSLILYLPHIIWQFQNDFITVKYQLFKREGFGFSVNNVLDYLVDQFLVYGPIVGFITIPIAFFYKARSDFEKILKLNVILTLLFFLIMSFRGRIEANWTCIMLVPLTLLSYNYLLNSKIRKIFYYLASFNAILILILRFHMIFPIFQIPNDPTAQFRNWNEFSKTIEKYENICATNYQLVSELYFYLKKPVGFININSRENEFSLRNPSIYCKYILSHKRTEYVLDSINAPYLGKVYIIIKDKP